MQAAVNKQHLPYMIHHPHLLFYCFISFFASSHCSIPNGRCNGGRDITLTRTPRLIVECCNVFTSTNYNTFAIALSYVSIRVVSIIYHHRILLYSVVYTLRYLIFAIASYIYHHLCNCIVYLSSFLSAILIPLLLALSIFLSCCRCCAAYHIINIIG